MCPPSLDVVLAAAVLARRYRAHPDAHIGVDPVIGGAFDRSARVEKGLWFECRALDVHLGQVKELCDGNCAKCAVGALRHLEDACCSDGVDHRAEELVVDVGRERRGAHGQGVVSVVLFALPLAELQDEVGVRLRVARESSRPL